jgi:hypothetical protein
MHSVRIHWISGYSQFAGGSIFMSYNVNEAQKGANFTVSSIFAQQNSGKSRLAENSSFAIPASSWRRTPNRRMCSGNGSYLFDLRYAISTSESTQSSPITVWIEYDVTFHTPQIESIQQPTPTSTDAVFISCEGDVFSVPTGSIESNNCTWEVTGAFEGLVYTPGASYTSSGERDGGTITVTFTDDSQATIESTFASGSFWPSYTFTSISGQVLSNLTSVTSPSTAINKPVKFYSSTKEIKKIQLITPASTSPYVIYPIPK